MSRLLENLSTVRERVAAAALRSGRRADAVTLVAVTKYVAVDVIYELVEAGCGDLGEARPQALRAKANELALRLEHAAARMAAPRWHLIGHLQRNKVAAVLPWTAMIHSADSLALLEAIEAAAAKSNRLADVLIEVNVSGEAAKHGFSPDQVEPVLAAVPSLEHIRVNGLMCMAAHDADEKTVRRNFASLRELGERLMARQPDIHLEHLSMGMSGDYELAIEEGATMVRVGSALFEGIGQ